MTSQQLRAVDFFLRIKVDSIRSRGSDERGDSSLASVRIDGLHERFRLQTILFATKSATSTCVQGTTSDSKRFRIDGSMQHDSIWIEGGKAALRDRKKTSILEPSRKSLSSLPVDELDIKDPYDSTWLNVVQKMNWSISTDHRCLKLLLHIAERP